jgi:hypothetical protein
MLHAAAERGNVTVSHFDGMGIGIQAMDNVQENDLVVEIPLEAVM